MGELFQLSIEIYDAKEEKVIWSDRWQEKWDILPSIKNNLSDGLLKTLNIKPRFEEKVETANPEAYEFYLRGNVKWKKRKNKDDIEIARKLYRKAIEIDGNLFRAINHLAFSYQVLGDFNEAMKLYKSSLKKAEQNEDKVYIAGSLRGIGMVYSGLEKYEEHFKYVNKSRKIFQDIGNNYGIAITTHDIGNYYSKKGDFEEAINCYQQALSIYKELDEIGYVTLITLGFCYHHIGKLDKALENFRYLQKYYLNEENMFRLSIVYGSIGQIYLDKGNFNNSIEYLEKSNDIVNEIGSHPGAKLRVSSYLYLARKKAGLKFNKINLQNLIKENYDYWNERGTRTFEDSELPFVLYQLLEEITYLQTAYSQIQEKANNLEPDVKAKFLSYPIPKAIVEEWEKVK